MAFALPSPIRRLAVLPVWRALLALAAGLLGAALLRTLPWVGTWPLVGWALGAGLLAALVGLPLGLGSGWRTFAFLVPIALAWQLGHEVPGWLYPALLGGLLLVFGGGVLTRAPLYNSNAEAWRVLEAWLPEGAGTFVDLGAGLGGALAHLSRTRPDWRFRGVEASPLVCLAAWLRCRRPNCRVRLGSLWTEPLKDCTVAYAFLSPAPMADLWEKVCHEMAPGTLLISHSFEVPGVEPERFQSLNGREGACLRLYRVP